MQAHYRYDICFSTPVPGSLDTLYHIADTYLDSYSFSQGSGVWKGASEHSYTLSVVLPSQEDDWRVYDLAKEYKRIYEQEAVLVQSYPITAVLV